MAMGAERVERDPSHPPPVVLHVGPPGTAALGGADPAGPPALLEHLRARLAPSRRPWDAAGAAAAVRAWASLVDAVRAMEGEVVVRSPHLSAAPVEVAREILDELGGGRVRVVVTLARFDALLATGWRDEVVAGLRTPFAEWAQLMAIGPGTASGDAPFWVWNDGAGTVERWVEAAGVDRVEVVIEQHTTDAALRSPTLAHAELVRRLNLAPDGVPDDVAATGAGTYGPVSTAGASLARLLAEHRPGPLAPPTTIARPTVDGLRAVADDAAERIRSAARDIRGPLDELAPPDDPHAPPVAPPIDDIDIDAVVDLAETLIRSAPRRRRAATTG